MPEELVSQSIELPSGELRVLQPRESAELPDAGAVEWAPIAPYWSVLWRSGVALACELDGVALRGLRVVELGCGLAAPSITAARAGAAVLATDACAEALTLVARNAQVNDVRIETATVSLLPRLAPEAWLADPGRPAVVAFLEQAGSRWSIETRDRDDVLVHRLQLG